MSFQKPDSYKNITTSQWKKRVYPPPDIKNTENLEQHMKQLKIEIDSHKNILN